MEWIFPAINLRLIMPEIILCFFAILILIVDPFLKKGKKMISAHLSWIAIALAFVANLSLWDFQEITFSDMFLVDNYATFFKFIFLVGSFTASISA